jgi:hypothetical protein
MLVSPAPLIQGLGPDFCARKQVYVSYRMNAGVFEHLAETGHSSFKVVSKRRKGNFSQIFLSDLGSIFCGLAGNEYQ